MKAKWWHFLVGLGGAVVTTYCLLIAVLFIYLYKNRVAGHCEDKAQGYYRMGEYEEAVKWYDRALKLGAKKWENYYRKAEALRELGRYEEAVESYDGALAQNPSHLFPEDIYAAKARALADLGMWDEAVETYAEAISPELPGSFEDLRNTGTAILESERREVATEGLFDTRQRAWPSGKYVEAIVYFKAAAKLEPQNGYPYYMIGCAWLALEQYERAASYFDVACESRADYAAAWAGKGWALALMVRYDDALECYDRALALDPDESSAWYYKGATLLFFGETEAALQYFERALELNPELTQGRLHSGAAYFMQGKYAQARAAFWRCRGDEGCENVSLYLYLVDQAEGREGAGQDLLSEFGYGGDPWVRNIAGFLVGETGADDLLSRAAGDGRKLCETHFYIGYKNKADGDAAAARLHFEEAVATDKRQYLEYTLALHELRRSGFIPAASAYASAPTDDRVRFSPPGITGAAATNGLRSSAVIARIVNQRKAGLELIYKKYLEADPNLEGKIVVRFTIEASGAVAACSVVSSTVGNSALEQEVCDHIMTWRFPPINEGDVAVVHPFVFFSAGTE